MKNCILLFLIGIFIVCSVPGFSQDAKELAPGYYVVVGAYAKSKANIAQNYVEVLKLNGVQADYGFNSSRNLYFAYIKYFNNLKESLRYMEKARQKNEFKDAWVRVVPGYVATAEPTQPAAQKTDTPVSNATEVKTETATTQPAAEVKSPADSIVVTDNEEIKQYEHMTLGNTEVFLSLYNARNNRIVDGDVEVIDTERVRSLTKVKGNEYLLLPDPKSKSGQLTLICEVFGYRKVQHEINYPLPLADTVKPNIDLMGTTMVVNFDLVRYTKGEINTLFNVYFFNDAAVMRPESQYELGNLLAMMEEDPGYRIRLHGHTNGNYHGKIVTMGPDKNFFSLDGSKQTVGSARDLSFNRAEVIKEYLISKGIAADRMEIKAWGGKRPIYDKHSANAKKNVRVEVEILEE
ncbi:MAG TPA: OmpA family protein [Ohtaekwangia sp.]